MIYSIRVDYIYEGVMQEEEQKNDGGEEWEPIVFMDTSWSGYFI